MAKLSENTISLQLLLAEIEKLGEGGGASSEEIAEYTRLIEKQRVIIQMLAEELATKGEGASEDLTEELTSLQTEIEEQQDLIRQLTEALVLHGGESLISFSFNGVTYQAREGSCWGEWIYSDYNPFKSETNSTMGGFYTISWPKVEYYYAMGLSGDVQLNGVSANSLDLIVADASYTYVNNGSSDY